MQPHSLRPMLIALTLAAALLSQPAQAGPAPDLTLTGNMTGQDHQTYREVSFRVPAGVTQLTVDFAYTGGDQKSVIDLGLRDPQRFRGWSGGNKSRITLSDAEATPSYLPGPLPAGTWKLVLGVPNIRAASQATYTARIYFQRDATFAGFQAEPLKAGPGWYRGDLHMHTGHSDGTCLSRRGQKVPCPVFKTLEVATARGLDFIAITDHNATSQNGALRELAPYFDDLLLIPGREITTFFGHANVFGPTGPLDFQLGSPRARDLAAILTEVKKAGGLISINHPGLPSGELCMGCGWAVKDADMARISAIEVVNGGSLVFPGGAESAVSGLPFWERQLNSGFKITGIGGSDNHDASLDPGKPGSVGSPTTVVHATDLSQPAILEAIAKGHVFIDVTGSTTRLLEVTAIQGERRVQMGDDLVLAKDEHATLQVRVVGAKGGIAQLVGDGVPQGKGRDLALDSDDATVTVALTGDGARHWIGVHVRSPDGRLWLIGNPIYLVAP